MRTCPYCHAEFSDKEVFCPVCGQEIQIVPDFETVESRFREAKIQSEKAREAEQEVIKREAAVRKRIRQRRRNIILTFVIAAAVIVGAIIFVRVRQVFAEHQTYEWQYAQAEELYGQGDYEQAELRILEALSYNDQSNEAKLLASRIYLAQEMSEEAENLLLQVISADPGQKDSYALLFDLYMDQGRTGDIQEFLRNCTNEEILSTYAAYLPSGPAIVPGEGTYSEDLEVEIRSDLPGTIYYTTDGTDPTGDSDVYSGPIMAKEGITTIKAFVVTDDGGFVSPVSEAIYQVQYDAPPAPSITPESGTYVVKKYFDKNGIMMSTSDEEKKITISYPDGFTCHYSFDSKPDADSPVYNGPVKMEKGDHIFYAVLESPTGQLGAIASATYKYEVKSITPTPSVTPTPQVTYSYYAPVVVPAAGGTGTTDNPEGDGGKGDTPSGENGGNDPSSNPGDNNSSGEGGNDAGTGGNDAGGNAGDGGNNAGGGDTGAGGGDAAGGGEAPAPAADAGGGDAAPAPSAEG